MPLDRNMAPHVSLLLTDLLGYLFGPFTAEKKRAVEASHGNRTESGS